MRSCQLLAAAMLAASAAWCQAPEAAPLDGVRKQIAAHDFDGALQALDGVLKSDPKNVAARLLRASALTQSGKSADALPVVQEVLAQEPESADALFELGRAQLGAGRHKEASEAFEKVARTEPTTTRGLGGMVEVDLARHETVAAMRLIEVQLEKTPGRADVHALLGITAARTGALDVAVKGFTQAAGLMDPKSRATAEVYLRLSDVYRRKDDFAKAGEAARKAREIEPQNAVVLASLGLILDQAGRREEAREAYEAALKVNPENAAVMNNLAFLLADSGGDLQRALALAQQARDKLPGVLDVSDTIGWIYYKAGMSGAAQHTFEELVKRNPDSGTFRYHLGMACLLNGNKERAKKELREALSHRPTRQEVDKILATLKKLE